MQYVSAYYLASNSLKIQAKERQMEIWSQLIQLKLKMLPAMKFVVLRIASVRTEMHSFTDYRQVCNSKMYHNPVWRVVIRVLWSLVCPAG